MQIARPLSFMQSAFWSQGLEVHGLGGGIAKTIKNNQILIELETIGLMINHLRVQTLPSPSKPDAQMHVPLTQLALSPQTTPEHGSVPGRKKYL